MALNAYVLTPALDLLSVKELQRFHGRKYYSLSRFHLDNITKNLVPSIRILKQALNMSDVTNKTGFYFMGLLLCA